MATLRNGMSGGDPVGRHRSFPVTAHFGRFGRRLALFSAVGMALLSIGQLPGGAAAGVSDYPATLYLSGMPAGLSASALSGSYKLGTASGPGQPTGVLTLSPTGAGVLSGSYSYAYTLVDATGGETAVNSPVAPTIASLSMKSVTVSGLPTGVTVRLYRKGAQVFRLIATLPNNSSSTYLDNAPDPSPDNRTILPQSQTKQAAGVSNVYYEFVPGLPMGSTTATSTPVSGPNFAAGKGWIVDGGGPVNIAAGQWTFTTNLKGMGTGIGVAHLVIGMWKVDDSGAVVGSPIIDPTTTGENTAANIATTPGTATPVVTTFTSIGAISLAANEHLFVEFWRHQIGANTGNATTTLLVYDGVTKIVHPSVPDAPALGAVTARAKTAPTLSSTFSDPDGADTGTLSFQVCDDSACSTVLQSGTASSVANGASGTFTPTPLTDGTYYWRSRAQDSSTNQSDWSTTNSFVIDNVAPNTPSLGTVASRVNAAPQLSASFSDVAAADTGSISFQVCTSSGCGTVLQSSTSAMVANGASGSWTPSALADGVYYWRAYAQDFATNLSGWSAAGTFTIDTIAPNIPTLTSPADATHVHSLQVSATFSEPDAADSGSVSFQLCADAACSTIVAGHTSATVGNATSVNWAPSVADGTYYWRARAEDVATNASAWSAPRAVTLDTTVPAVPALGTIVARVNLTPQLAARFSDANVDDTGTVSLQLCTSSACSSVLQSIAVSGVANGADATWTPSGLSPGTYYWRARVEDLAANVSVWSAAGSFTIDTTPPNTPILGALAPRVNTTPQLSASFSDTAAADTGTVSFELCSDSACATVLQSSTSAMLANGAAGSWTPSAVADGVYYWRARAQDLATNLSGWSSTRSFTVDTVVPSLPALTGVGSGQLGSMPTLASIFVDAGDNGTLTFQLCADAACAAVVATQSSGTLASGSSSSWHSGGADGTYYARVRAADAAGNTTAWSQAVGFQLDTGTPDVPVRGGIAERARTAHTPSLSARFSDPGGTDPGTIDFQLCTTSTCTVVLQSSTASSIANGTTSSWTPETLQDGSYAWRARAGDAAGNRSAWSPATTFTIDNTPPAAPTVSTERTSFRSSPLLTAGVASDTARAVVQVCSDAACNTIVAADFAGRSANGISFQAPPLPQGVYYWHALAEDDIGNSSGWSNTGSFAIDTATPEMPVVSASAAGAPVSRFVLNATVPDGIGKVGFKICSDPACTVVVIMWWSDDMAAGTPIHWTPSGLPDGMYYWRASAADAAGNRSSWSDPQTLELDATPPPVPRALQATVSKNTLSLRWKTPTGEAVAAYALFVNGKQTSIIDVRRLGIDIRLRAGDKRTFAIAAIDEAGNVGARTRVVTAAKKLPGRLAATAPARR